MEPPGFLLAMSPGSLIPCNFFRDQDATEDSNLRTIVQIIFVVGILLMSASFVAADQRTRLNDEDIEQRLAFIEQRLNEGRTSARTWQYGWSGFFAASAVLQGYNAIQSNNSDNETNYTVGAIKSSAALALMLVRPLPAVDGAAPLQTMPSSTPEQKEARLKAAEYLLHTNARRAHERTSWSRHLMAIAVHFIGSTAIFALGDAKDALVSNLTGVAISQAHIWSQPSRAIDDLADYERQFPTAAASDETTWQLTPIRGGLGITIRF